MRLSISVRAIALFFSVIFSGTAFGDQRSTFIHMACVPEIGFFEITPTYIWNVPEERAIKRLMQKKHKLFPEGSGKFSCVLNDSTIKVQYRTESCNHYENSQIFIDMWVNDLKVIHQVVFADTCYSAATTRIWYSQEGSVGFDANPAYGMFDSGPVTVSFFAGLVGDEFNNFSANDEALPITMSHINKRIDGLVNKAR
ncbi:MAG: hypothetical protein Q8J80_04490 [Gallionella sp.]|nr:hypothetical protein [Gallionella sp.]